MRAIRRAKIFKGGVVRDGVFYPAVIAIAFAAGTLIGYLASREFAQLAEADLTAYWQKCLTQTDMSASWMGVVQTVLQYVQCVVFILLLCKTTIGAIAIPFLCVTHGFLLSFSVFSLSAALGIRNVAYLAVLFSARLLFWLPCVFHIAAVCFRESCRCCFKSKIPPGNVKFGKIPLLLLLGMVLELLVIPQLMLQLISK